MPEETIDDGFVLQCYIKPWYRRGIKMESYQFFDWEDVINFVKKEYGITREEWMIEYHKPMGVKGTAFYQPGGLTNGLVACRTSNKYFGLFSHKGFACWAW